ncbi:MAG: InlB B-repeat-containing protein, partial [Oscillospiraceae bacterium]|nr:InlB B-repeat-containing protein [Oscillospiraceae bacterium]
MHKLYFYNVNSNLGDGTGSSVRYGASLAAHGEYFKKQENIKYPTVYEKDAYKFVGWYRTPNFVDGTEMVWETEKMPDADFTVYAKWEPVKHYVYFYLDYDHLQSGTLLQITDKEGNEQSNPLIVPHNETIQFQLQTPTKEGYIFLGWFYMDGVEKKRFSPEIMGLKRDRYLFAEWHFVNDASTEYTVSYQLRDGTEIAPSISGYSGVGRTKTFHAKGGESLYEAYRTGYFPVVASHSILMKPKDPDNPNNNTWTFEYVQDDEVSYTVRFLNVVDQTVLHEEIVKTTSQAVVTERFIPISGYMPLPGYVYQTKSLQSDDEYGGVHPNNVITFYYIEDTEHGVYAIEYYLQDLPVQNQPTTFSLMTSFTNTADLMDDGQVNSINSGDEFELLNFEGFTFDYAYVINYVLDEDSDGKAYMKESIVQTIDATEIEPNPTVSGEINANGISIRLYYSRNNVEYTIKYVDNESGDVLYSSDVISGQGGTVERLTAPFGTEITHTAGATCTTGMITYNYFQKDATEEQRTKSITLRSSRQGDPATRNELVFYYLKPVLTIRYHTVCLTPNATGFGGVTYNSETSTAGAIVGSTAIAAYGFRFAGWFA